MAHTARADSVAKSLIFATELAMAHAAVATSVAHAAMVHAAVAHSVANSAMDHAATEVAMAYPPFR